MIQPTLARAVCLHRGMRLRATALVEFALISFPLVVLVIGSFGFGEVLRAQLVVDRAAQEAVHVAAAVRPADGGDPDAQRQASHLAQARVDAILSERHLESGGRADVSGNFSRGEVGNPAIVTVRVKYSYRRRLTMPLLDRWFSRVVHLEGVAHESIPRFTSVWP